MTTTTLTTLIRERALELGFSRAGVIPVGPTRDADRLSSWLAAGRHGEMAYMERHAALRRDSSRLEPWARSVIAVAAPHDPTPPRPSGPGRWSRYALSDDYHDVLRARLAELAAFVRAEAGAERVTRATVDSAPVLERSIGVEAGLGWLGKSAMVLDQVSGPYLLLAELFVDVELDPYTQPHPDRCGRCTRCVDACPTGAILSPYQVDARRCISYLTIELKGPIPRGLRPLVGDHIFGCDVCQEVCPWSMRAAAPVVPGLQRREIAISAREALSCDRKTFDLRFAGTAVARTRRRGLARNAAVVLGNSGDRGHVDVLTAALSTDSEPIVRGHAAWALGVLGGAPARAALDRAWATEDEDYVREELRAAMESH
ncbi:MAG: tRNA epoxyqueuosine(34) reductase QueG [Myxococcales bacterium]|nr:tRNA epoxyqueuosine(34) reductase QueG [Myxococcales bacterium]